MQPLLCNLARLATLILMFTGIIQAKSTIAQLDRQPFGLRLSIHRPPTGLPDDRLVQQGESICVSGTCLTVAHVTESTFAFDVILETLARTKLGKLVVGDEVNLETAVTPNQPLGGHFMQGHVDGLGRIIDIQCDGEENRLTIQPPPDLIDYIIPKGSIAIDGVSLTIASTDDHTFQVALIPTTLELTTLGNAAVGDSLNIEADILAKTVVHHLQRHAATSTLARVDGLTWQDLQNAGLMPSV